MPVPWNTRDTLTCLVAPFLATLAGSAFWAAGLTITESSRYDLRAAWVNLCINLREIGNVAALSGVSLGLLAVVHRLLIHPQLPSHRRIQRLALGGGLFFPVAVIALAGLAQMPTGPVILPFLHADGDYTSDILLVLHFAVQGAVFGLLVGKGFGPVPASRLAVPTPLGWLRAVAVAFGAMAVFILPSTYFWKRRTDREGCVLNLRNAQQAMRSYQGMNGLWVGGHPGFGHQTLIGPGNFLEVEPQCPGGGTYTWEEGRIPDVGELFLHCSHPDHVPDDHTGW